MFDRVVVLDPRWEQYRTVTQYLYFVTTSIPGKMREYVYIRTRGQVRRVVPQFLQFGIYMRVYPTKTIF